MRYLLASIAITLVLGPAWQHALAGQPDSGPGTTEGAATSGGSAGSPDCGRSLTGPIVDSRVSAQRLIGMPVVNPLDEEIGRLADLILDQCGGITHVVVHIGGFMGLGGEQVAVPVDKVRIRPRGPAASWVALVRETREHMLKGYDEPPHGQIVR